MARSWSAGRPCADDHVRSPRPWLGRDARRILGGRAFVGRPIAAPLFGDHAGAHGTMADAAGDGRENGGTPLDQVRLDFTISPDFRRSVRCRCGLSDLAKHVVSRTVLAARRARTLPSCLHAIDRWAWWIYGARHACRGRLPARRGGRGRAVHDGRMAPGNVLAASLRAEANLAARAPEPCFRSSGSSTLNRSSHRPEWAAARASRLQLKPGIVMKATRYLQPSELEVGGPVSCRPASQEGRSFLARGTTYLALSTAYFELSTSSSRLRLWGEPRRYTRQRSARRSRSGMSQFGQWTSRRASRLKGPVAGSPTPFLPPRRCLRGS